MHSVAIHKCYIQSFYNGEIISMNSAEKLLEPTIFFNLYTRSLAKESFKSNLEFRYQIIVSSIKFRKCFAKFMIPIALFKKFLS